MEEKNQKRIACKIDMNDIMTALHKKAIEKAAVPNYKIINSAISGEGETSKFNSSGKNIISILPVNNNVIIDKEECYNALIKYITFFNGKDIASKITVDDLKPLVKEYPLTKDKKDNVDESSIVNTMVMKLFEAEDDQQKIAQSNGQKIIGYYVDYDLDVGTKRKSKNDDPWDRLKKGIKNQLADMTVTFSGIWGQGKSHNLGNLMKDMDYKSIDATKLPGSVRQQFSIVYPELHPEVNVIDSASLVNFLKNKISVEEKDKISSVDFVLCIKITKRDKTYDLLSKQEIADIVERSITRHGIGKIINPNGLTRDDVIYVNNYSDDLKDQQDKYFKKNSQLHEQQIIIANKMFSEIIGESQMLFEYISVDVHAQIERKINRVIDLFRGQNALSNDIRPDYLENINLELNPTVFNKKMNKVSKGEFIIDISKEDLASIKNELCACASQTDKPMQSIGNIYSEVYDYRDSLDSYDFSPSISSTPSGDIEVLNKKIEDMQNWYAVYSKSIEDGEKDNDFNFIKRVYDSLKSDGFKITADKKDKAKKLYDKLRSKSYLSYSSINTIERLIEKIKQYLNEKVITKSDLANILEIRMDYEGFRRSSSSNSIEAEYIDQRFKDKGIDFNDFTETLNAYITSKFSTLPADQQYKAKIDFLKSSISKINNIQKHKSDNQNAITGWDCYVVPLKNLKFPDIEPDTREHSGQK